MLDWPSYRRYEYIQHVNTDFTLFNYCHLALMQSYAVAKPVKQGSTTGLSTQIVFAAARQCLFLACHRHC